MACPTPPLPEGTFGSLSSLTQPSLIRLGVRTISIGYTCCFVLCHRSPLDMGTVEMINLKHLGEVRSRLLTVPRRLGLEIRGDRDQRHLNICKAIHQSLDWCNKVAKMSLSVSAGYSGWSRSFVIVALRSTSSSFSVVFITPPLTLFIFPRTVPRLLLHRFESSCHDVAFSYFISL